ncbi:MAG: DNA-protecting protein DprA [Kofleriaceae bacterium]|nr:DNA-protecting protein DprA [Kofleriaceae bacterium]
MIRPNHIIPLDAAYPGRWQSLRSKPVQVAVQGNLGLLQAATTVAIVGSRAASTASMQLAERFAQQAAAAGMVVVSGGALGIDGAAHRGALAQTIVVMGSGLRHWYPTRHVDLFTAVVAAGGALISTFPDDAQPVRSHFVARNRFIAALADVVVVVEAQPRSGSLSTAQYGWTLGRHVLAVPGSPGCDGLLGTGRAHICESFLDVAAAVRGEFRVAAVPPLADEHCERLVAALDTQPLDEDALAQRAGLTIQQTLRALCKLDGTPHVVKLPGQRFARPTTFCSATEH